MQCITKPLRTLLTAMLMLAPASVACARPPAQSDETLGHLSFRSVRIDTVDTTRLGLRLRLSVTSGRSLSVQQLVIQNLRLNGIPVQAEPVRQPFRLVRGTAVDLPDLAVSLFLRDLRNTSHLRAMLENGSAHVEGEAIARVQLGFFEKLAVKSMDPAFFLSFSQDIPLERARDPLQRRAALAVLSALDVARASGSTIIAHLPHADSAWPQSLAKNNLFELNATYQVADPQGRVYPIVLRQLGFRCGPSTVLATAEILDPAAFDPEIQAHIGEHEASIQGAVDLTIRSLGSGSAVSSSASSESVGQAGLQTLLANDGHTRIKVRQRASPNALTVVHLPENASPAFYEVPTAIAAQNNWPQIAVFRLLTSAGQASPSFELVELSAVRTGDRIQLSQALDPSTYGSPILTPDGVLGVVQDQSTGTFLPPQSPACK